jgi:hypothetical protein
MNERHYVCVSAAWVAGNTRGSYRREIKEDIRTEPFPASAFKGFSNPQHAFCEGRAYAMAAQRPTETVEDTVKRAHTMLESDKFAPQVMNSEALVALLKDAGLIKPLRVRLHVVSQ